MSLFKTYLNIFVLLIFTSLTMKVNAGYGGLAVQLPQLGTYTKNGNYQYAILQWQSFVDKTTNPKVKIRALIHLTEAYQALGETNKALSTAKHAYQFSQQHNSLNLRLVLGLLAHTYLASGQLELSKKYFEQALDKMSKSKLDKKITATIINNYANLLMVTQSYDEAFKLYTKSSEIAKSTQQPLLAVNASINAIRSKILAGKISHIKKDLQQAVTQLQSLPNTQQKVYSLIVLGKLYRRSMNSEGLYLAHDLLTQALQLAKNGGDIRSQSYALGFLGELYEQTERYSEAITLTQQALFFAQQLQAHEALYRWYWQIGRLLHAQGNLQASLDAYRNAVIHLKAIRNEISIGYGGVRIAFRETIGPLFFQLADILLQQARTLNSNNKTMLLREAQDAIEQLKTAELEDYFKDDCVAVAQSKNQHLNNIDPHTVIIYPILLPSRIELLVNFSDGLQQFTVPVPRTMLVKTTNALRQNLEYFLEGYLPPAQQLYQWLIHPLKNELMKHQIKTLIFVPDGILRTIPMSVLHNGQNFLVHDYNIGTIPGLALIGSQSTGIQQPRILLNGLSESVQGFDSLLGVNKEVNAIQRLYPNNDLLFNRNFVVTKMTQALQDSAYGIVHIASHAQFDQNPEKTFILTYDGKMSMDQIEQMMGSSQYRQQPVELLTLSACQSAAGDERAALGLAGIAIKAGARSALATLWSIEDEASSLLVIEFYQRLKQGASKVEALRQAQLKLLADPLFQHPALWSAFLLIGNWL